MLARCPGLRLRTMLTRTGSAPRDRGFTIAELVIVMAVLSILVALAYPSFRAQWLKARRADAHNALMQLQQAQERWRADHRRYASAAELSAPDTSSGGHYRLSVHATSATGYELRAEALGAQRGDAGCRIIGLRQAEGTLQWLAGGDDASLAPAVRARRCWPT